MNRRFWLALLPVPFLLAAGIGAAIAWTGNGAAHAREEFAALVRTCPNHQDEQDAIFAELFADGVATLAEWANAIPRYLPLMQESSACVAALPAPEKLARPFAQFNAAMTDFLRLQGESLDAARAGDQERFDALEAESQGPVKDELAKAAKKLGLDFFE